METAITGETRLAPSGELTLAGARQLQADLLDCLGSGEPVVLDMQLVTEIELACLQVVAAARRSFGARERALQVLWGQTVGKAWDQAGFPREE